MLSLSVVSAPSLGVYYFCRWHCLSVCLYVCMSVTLLQIDSFLFLDGIEPFFGRQFSVWYSTKCCSSIFDLGPLTPKMYSQKLGTKSPISRLVWHIDRRYLGLLRVFGDGRCNGTMLNVVGRPLLPWQRHFGKLGIFLHKIAYKSACMQDRPDTFVPTRGADPCCHSYDICARCGV